MTIYDGIMDGLSLARQGAAEHKQRGLASLVGQAYSAPQQQRGSLLAKIAGIDPATATQTQSSLGAWDDSKQAALVRSAKMLLTAPEEARPQVWAQIVQAGEIPGLKPDYDPVKVPEMAQRIVQQFGGSTGGTVQSRFVGEDGQVYALMRDGSVQSLGIKADPRTQIMEAAGGIVGIDKRTLQANPVLMGQPGVQSREVPFTIDPSLPPEVQADIRRSEAQGQPWTQAPQLQPAPKEAPAQSVTLNSDEVAQLGLPAGSVVQRDLATGKLNVVNKPTPPRTVTMTATERRDLNTLRRRVPELQAMPRRLQRIREAVQSLKGGMINTGPLDQYAQRFTKEGNELEQAVAQMMPALTALTRVPGVGSQSDWEGRLNMMQLPSLANHPIVNERAIAELDAFITDLANAYTDAINSYVQPAEQRPADAPQGSAIPVNDTSDDDLIGKYL